MIEPNEDLRLSTERQDEQYRHVRYWDELDNKQMTPGWEHEPGWYGFCCGGCHGCGGAPITNKYPRPIDAHLARLEWIGEVPISEVRIVS